MKKILFSTLFVAAFGAYALYQNLGGASAATSATIAQNPTANPQTSGITIADLTPVSASASSQHAPTAAQTTTSQSQNTSASVPTSNAAPATTKPKGQYVDGTYDGSVADAYYGYVQVRATVSGGKLADVTFLQYPNDRDTSRYINSQAMPYLKQEAIQAQSARVSGVSGASETSRAFVESLGAALAQAKA